MTKILVVRTDRLGDMLLTLPAVADLKRSLTDAQVTLLCAPGVADLAACCPQVDVVHPCEVKAAMTGLQDWLRDQAFDAVVVCHSTGRLVWRLWRAGIPLRVGSGRRLHSLLFNLRDNTSRSRHQLHEAQGSREFVRLLLERLGADSKVCDWSPVTELTLPPRAGETASALWSAVDLNGPVVVLQPGSGGSSLEWPRHLMVELADRLRGAGYTVIVHVGPGEQQLLQQFDGFHCFGRDLDLVGLAGVLQRADALVGNSTGPLHLAAALGTPVVGLYPPVRSMTFRRWGPLGDDHVVITPPTDDNVVYPTKDAAPPDLMQRIPVETVLQAVRLVTD